MTVDPAARERAKHLFVDEGLGTSAIKKIIGGTLTQQTINNWRKKEGWDETRRAKIERSAHLRDRLEKLLENAITNAEINMEPKSIFTIAKLISALRTSTDIDFSDERLKQAADQKKKFTKENLAELEKELGVL
jgi:hypothetical protein